MSSKTVADAGGAQAVQALCERVMVAVVRSLRPDVARWSAEHADVPTRIIREGMLAFFEAPEWAAERELAKGGMTHPGWVLGRLVLELAEKIGAEARKAQGGVS